MNKYDIERLACMQLSWLIKKGKCVEECKVEWFRRWKLEYPYYKSVRGIEKHE